MGVGRRAGRIFCLYRSERETMSRSTRTLSEGSERPGRLALRVAMQRRAHSSGAGIREEPVLDEKVVTAYSCGKLLVAYAERREPAKISSAEQGRVGTGSPSPLSRAALVCITREMELTMDSWAGVVCGPWPGH